MLHMFCYEEGRAAGRRQKSLGKVLHPWSDNIIEWPPGERRHRRGDAEPALWKWSRLFSKTKATFIHVPQKEGNASFLSSGHTTGAVMPPEARTPARLLWNCPANSSSQGWNFPVNTSVGILGVFGNCWGEFFDGIEQEFAPNKTISVKSTLLVTESCARRQVVYLSRFFSVQRRKIYKDTHLR